MERAKKEEDLHNGNSLIEDYKTRWEESNRDYSKALLYVSSGAFAIVINFIKYDNIENRWFLFFSSLCYGICISICLVYHNFYLKRLEKLVDGHDVSSHDVSSIDKLLRRIYPLLFGSFVLGTIIFFIYLLLFL